MSGTVYYRDGAQQLEALLELMFHRLALLVPAEQGEQGAKGEPVPTARAAAEASLKRAEAAFRRKSDAAARMRIDLPLERLCVAFGATPFQRFLLMFALACDADTELLILVARLAPPEPTLGLAWRLYALTESVSPQEALSQHVFLHALFAPGAPGARPLARPLRLRRKVFGFLLGADMASDVVSRYALADEPPPMRFYQPMLDGLRMMEDAARLSSMLFLLTGAKGAGKRLLLRHLCKRLGRELLIIDLDAVVDDPAAWEENIADILFECRLCGGVVALRAGKQQEEDVLLPHTVKLVKALEGWTDRIWLLTERKWNHAPQLVRDGWDFIKFAMPELSAPQRKELWLSLPGVEEFDADFDLLSGKFLFTPGQIERAYRDARHIADWRRGEESGDRVLTTACRQLLEHNLGAHATLISSPFEWDDLVLPQEKKALLFSICEQVRNHSKVFGDWGLARRIPYGSGLSVLFTGQPGTGTSMAAQVLANQLGIELYQVNLASVVSKYIGEMEKNLELVFTEAGKSRCILFFDEADALFAKRTELKDSNDRFANADSAYLLQRIENYTGIVVLATNYAQNFDPAFKRRIKYTVDFPMPDEESRYLMWQKILSPPMPVDPSQDLPALAAQYELTGSEIKNIAMNAAFLAAEGRSAIAFAHVQRALRAEYAKSGRVVVMK